MMSEAWLRVAWSWWLVLVAGAGRGGRKDWLGPKSEPQGASDGWKAIGLRRRRGNVGGRPAKLYRAGHGTQEEEGKQRR